MENTLISRENVGRIAERIVANELESRGYRVTDLNKEGVSANADLLAARDGRTWQVQVKGSTWEQGPWFNYGHSDDDMIQKRSPVFNRRSGFYSAEIVALVCVKSLSEYWCVILPVADAERAAQLNLDLFRVPKKDGAKKKPGKMWCDLEYIPNTKDSTRRKILEEEQTIIKSHLAKWEIFEKTDTNN